MFSWSGNMTELRRTLSDVWMDVKENTQSASHRLHQFIEERYLAWALYRRIILVCQRTIPYDSTCTLLPASFKNSAWVYMKLHYLRIEWEQRQFKLLVEFAGHATSFEDERFHFRIEHDRVPDVLLQLNGAIVDVQVGIPVSRPVDLFRVLQNFVNKWMMYYY